ncbi:MAG: glycosyltransferase family 4 protein [Propionibacteriaceae bacterium]|jgi:glycosyltransferase involved in cell wall biosynthesis|nr:glycosyltransferase family 4 protein [Propionibacteriaceae bacterium]
MKNGRPTVAIFAAHFPPSPGGIAKWMQTNTGGLADLGVNTVVVTTDYGEVWPEDHPLRTVYRLPVKSLPGRARYPFIKKGAAFRSIMREVAAQHIDAIIVITRFHMTSFVGAKLGKQLGVPVHLVEAGANALTVNNKILDLGLRLIESGLWRLLKSKITDGFAMSAAGAEYLSRRFGLKSRGIWTCSIDAGAITKPQHKTVRILYSGRIENLKGEEQLAQAYSQLVDQYPDTEVWYAGDGSYLPVLKAKYANDRHFRFYGQVSQDDVSALNLEADIVVCATRFPDGAVPNAVIEAGAAECAVIVSPNGGFRELIRDGENGLYTKPDLSDMKDRLVALIKDPGMRRRLGKQLHVDVSERFRPDQVAATILRGIHLNGDSPNSKPMA